MATLCNPKPLNVKKLYKEVTVANKSRIWGEKSWRLINTAMAVQMWL